MHSRPHDILSSVQPSLHLRELPSQVIVHKMTIDYQEGPQQLSMIQQQRPLLRPRGIPPVLGGEHIQRRRNHSPHRRHHHRCCGGSTLPRAGRRGGGGRRPGAGALPPRARRGGVGQVRRGGGLCRPRAGALLPRARRGGEVRRGGGLPRGAGSRVRRGAGGNPPLGRPSRGAGVGRLGQQDGLGPGPCAVDLACLGLGGGRRAAASARLRPPWVGRLLVAVLPAQVRRGGRRVVLVALQRVRGGRLRRRPWRRVVLLALQRVWGGRLRRRPWRRVVLVAMQRVRGGRLLRPRPWCCGALLDARGLHERDLALVSPQLEKTGALLRLRR
mmetsp:Transcript_54598/g.145875  ORF Transcript_54598/g.145875 Transcript_54598/m.145875 type:complete len:329 (-) Transcript_54598:131-1117(-)